MFWLQPQPSYIENIVMWNIFMGTMGQDQPEYISRIFGILGISFFCNGFIRNYFDLYFVIYISVFYRFT